MLMFTKRIHHKVVFFFRITTTIKKEKRAKYPFSLFYSNLSFFLGVVKMNNCIEFYFQNLSTALAIATTCSTSSLYSKGNRSLLIRVIASTRNNNNGPNNNYAHRFTISWPHSLFSNYSYMVENALKQDVKTQ